MSDDIKTASVQLRPGRMSWIKGAVDDPADLCVHGQVDFQVGQDVLVDPETSPEVPPSASALFLMRALAEPLPEAGSVADLHWCGR